MMWDIFLHYQHHMHKSQIILYNIYAEYYFLCPRFSFLMKSVTNLRSIHNIFRRREHILDKVYFHSYFLQLVMICELRQYWLAKICKYLVCHKQRKSPNSQTYKMKIMKFRSHFDRNLRLNFNSHNNEELEPLPLRWGYTCGKHYRIVRIQSSMPGICSCITHTKSGRAEGVTRVDCYPQVTLLYVDVLESFLPQIRGHYPICFLKYKKQYIFSDSVGASRLMKSNKYDNFETNMLFRLYK